MGIRVVAAIGMAGVVCWGCERAPVPKEKTPVSTQTQRPEARSPAPEKPQVKRRSPWPGRVVAIGDVHGDLRSLKHALQIAGVLGEDGERWVGGETVVVQTGDLLDRGDDEQEILDFLGRLGAQARAQGGRVRQLLGNHETMNVQGDLRYVTPGGFEDFVGVEGLDLQDPRLGRLPQEQRSRQAAFLPGGRYAVVLSGYETIAIVGDSLFAHGGVLPEHVAYGIDRLNVEVSQWMRGERAEPTITQGPQSPLWTRVFSEDPQLSALQCARLEQVLEATGTARMVVGHTPQPQGPSAACGGKVWRIDTGMARHYGGEPAALEIHGGEVRVLKQSAGAREETEP